MKNITVARIILYAEKENIYPAYVSKHYSNREKKLFFWWFQMENDPKDDDDINLNPVKEYVKIKIWFF